MERRGSRGEDWLIDVKAVWRWREKQARAEALSSSGMTAEGGFAGWLGIDDPVRAFQAQERMIRVGLLRETVVHREPKEA